MPNLPAFLICQVSFSPPNQAKHIYKIYKNIKVYNRHALEKAHNMIETNDGNEPRVDPFKQDFFYVDSQVDEISNQSEDPTIMTIDLQEQAFEARLYPITYGGGIARVRVISAIGPIGPLDRVIHSLADHDDHPVFKLLAKRDRENQKISYVLIGVASNKRVPLLKEFMISEERYRKDIEMIESVVVSSGIAEQPDVVSFND